MKAYLIELMPGLLMAIAYFVGVVCGAYWSAQEKKEGDRK